MGNCDARAGVDDEEVQLRGCCKNADSQLDKQKVHALSSVAKDAKDLDDGRAELAPIFDQEAQKDAIARLVGSFANGRELEVSSMIHGAGAYMISLNSDLTEMNLEGLADTPTAQRKWKLPLIYVLDATLDSSPGLQRYTLTSILRIRIGPHAGHGPDTMLLQLESCGECEIMALFLRASSRHLQNAATWERQRVMDDESVATTMVRSVQRLRDPSGLANLVLQKTKQKATKVTRKL